MGHLPGSLSLPAVPAGMTRQRSLLFLVCLFGLVVLWAWRLPQMTVLEAANTEATRVPVLHRSPDLSDPEAPFVGWPLARVCRETAWTPGLVFVCDNNSGGIGNIRNFMLTCIRYAIEAGATGLVMPRIRTRSSDDLADLMKEYRDFGYFFDEAYFRTSLTISCPRITIYNTTEDVPNASKPFRSHPLTPRNLGLRGGCDKRDLNRHTDLFATRFHSWLLDESKHSSLPPVSASHPRAVRLNWGVQWDWPVYRDGPEFVASYGGLLRFRSDILRLGKTVAAEARAFSSLSRSAVTDDGWHQKIRRRSWRERAAGGPTATGYVGFHLRSENDALSAWPTFDDQASGYLQAASHRGFGAGYLATGNRTEAQKFVEKARSQNRIRVATKHDLLRNRRADLEALEALSWDQQALVDFVVLLYCDYFLGVSPSSFSINVALKRHVKKEGLYTRPWRVGGQGDVRSWLLGKFDRYWDDWLFMYDSIWP
ncbi:hypothetical protein VTK73DRAFT_3969 [Phialemonium thermophilum]|uniref:Alternative oxidase n=1 Tax=Phialemonium thermophilum TaxID=223376 RepID=A0ABR3WVY3_9PEZI